MKVFRLPIRTLTVLVALTVITGAVFPLGIGAVNQGSDSTAEGDFSTTTILWTQRTGSPGDDTRGIIVDSSGVYVAGNTEGALPGQTSAGSADAFVRKYDHNGKELWTQQFGSSVDDDALE